MMNLKIDIPNHRQAPNPSRISLYHGTSAAFLPAIVEKGLLPRKAREDKIEFETLNDNTYDILKKWMFRGEISDGAISALTSDALAKGYSLSNRDVWPAHIDAMRNRRPLVIEPSRISREEKGKIERAALPIKSPLIRLRPLWKDGVAPMKSSPNRF